MSSSFRRIRFNFKVGAAATTWLAGFMLSGAAVAATRTYDGGTAGTGAVISTNTNWVSDTLPGSSDEALFDNSVVTTLPSVLSTTGALTFGDLVWNTNNTSTISLNSTGAGNVALTLSGGAGGTAAAAAGGNAADLLTVGSASTTSTLTIGGNIGTGTGTLTLAIGKAGNFDVVNSGSTLNLTAAITGAFALTKTGAGTMILAGANTFGVAGGNTAFTITSGTVILSGAGTLGGKTNDLAVNGTLDMGGTTQTVDSLTGTGTITNNGATASTLIIGNDFGSGTFSGLISDGTSTMALTKTGSNTATINAAQTYSGATIVSANYIGNAPGVITGALALSTSTGRVANSDVFMQGTTLSITDSAAGTVTRAKSITLGNAVMSVTGIAAGNTVNNITNALNLGGGRSTLTLTAVSASNLRLTAGSLTRANGSTALIRGNSLGLNSIASATVNSSNIVFTTAPTLLGSGAAGTNTVGIISYLYGDNSTTGVGTDFMTYDATSGLRRLTSSEYATTFASGNSTLVNAKITAAITAINSATSLNSLTLGPLGRVNGTGTLTVSSGGILAVDNSSIGTLTAGTLDFGTAEGVLLAVSGKTLTIGSSITGSGGLTAGGAGTVVLTGTNSYSGGTNLAGGVLNINSDAALGAVPGAPTNNLNFSGGTLQAGAATIALGSTRNIVTSFLGVNATFDTNGNAMSVAGIISGVGNVSKNGAGTLTLSGVNTYTGSTFAAGGTLNVTGQLAATNSLILVGGAITLDFTAATAPQNNIVNSAASLAFNIGAVNTAGVNTLTIQGKDGISNTQTFSSTNFANFASHLNITAGTGGTVTVNLGAITRSTPTINATTTSDPAGATLDITIGTGVTVTGTSGLTNGIIKGATVNGNTWATISGANVVGLTTYSSSFTTANANVDVGSVGGTLTADANTLRFNSAAAATVTLGGTNSLRNIQGGVLVTNAVGANTSLITGGVLSASNRRDIIFIQNNTAGILQIDSVITEQGGQSYGITKSGLGTLLLTAANTINGPAVINEGTIIVTGSYIPSVSVTGSMGTSSNLITGLSSLTGIYIGERVTNATAMTTASTSWIVTAIDTVNNTVTVSNNSSAPVTGGTFVFSGGGGLGSTTTANSVAAGATLQIGNGGSTGTLFSTQGINNNGSVVFNRSDTAGAFLGVIAGTGSVTQAGSGTYSLNGANTYTGATLVNSGILQAGNTTAFGVNSAMTIANSALVQLLGRSVSIGSLAGAGTLENANATNATLTLGGDNTSTTFSGVLQNGTGAGTLSIIKTGTGTQTLSGANTSTGSLSINGGAVSISGAFAGVINVANSGATGILNILPGATLVPHVATLLPSISIGSSAGASGAVYQTGGSVVFDGQLVFGSGGTNAYGFYSLSGGTIADTAVTPANERFRVGGATSNTVGIYYQSGTGAVNLAPSGSPTFEVGANAAGGITNATGLAYFTGGTLTALSNNIGADLNTGSVRGEETIAGTAVVTINGVTLLGRATSDVGVLNINGGTFATKQIVKGTSGKGYVNFNGGTLQAAASATGATFFTGLTAANIFSGGATFDTNGQSITITQALLAPTGNGVVTIPVVDGGVGYVGPPYVSISTSSGTPATAVANMVDDGTGNGTFKIASITITNPGTGYTGTPTVTLTGGGGTGAILGTAAIAANVSGGITKTGTGVLTLSGASTYTGATVVSQGTLQAGTTTNAFGVNSAVTVASGASLQLATRNNSIGSLSGTGIVENAGATSATLTTGGDNSDTDFGGVLQNGTGAGTLGLIKNGTGTQTLSGTNTYTGNTVVNGGTLAVSGSLANSPGTTTVNSSAILSVTGSVAGAVTVASGGTIMGTGTVGTGTTLVTIQNGGIISPGLGIGSVGTLSVNLLTLNATSVLNFDLGTTGASDLIAVTGASNGGTVLNTLVLDGTLNINALTGFGAGTYTLFTYTGAATNLINNGLILGNPVAGYTYSVNTATTGQVKLIVSGSAASVQYWDGSNNTTNNIVDGGSGTWNNTSTNWSTSDGSTNSAWSGGVAIFQGSAGNVAVADSIQFTGMQFLTTGYHLTDGTGSLVATLAASEIFVGSGLTTTFDVGIQGSGSGISKTGAGTLVLNHSNTYTGATSVAQGVLVAAVANALPSSSRVSVGPIGQTNGAELDINVSQTVASVTMGSTAGTDTLTIAAGQTLTITGNDGVTTANGGSSTSNAFRVGGNASSGATTTTAVVNGGGTLTINSPTANFAMDNVVNPDGNGPGLATLDLTGLAAFNANVANFRVGYGQRSQATLTLAASNTITTTVLTVGDSNAYNATNGSSLILGQTNVINASTINVGNSKGVGFVSFNSGLTAPTLKIRGSAGGSSRADLNVSLLTTTAAIPAASTLVFTASSGGSDGVLDAMFGTITLGKGSLSGNSGLGSGIFEFDNGTVDATTIQLGVVASTGSTGTGTNTGTFNIKGGNLIAGTVVLGTTPAGSTQNASGTFNITGGTVDMNGDITDGGGVSTLNLNGGTLDMHNHKIGSATQQIDTFTLASGTLQNVAEINNGGAVTKTTAGTLLLTGTNTYTGTTTVSAGTLQVGSGSSGQSGTGAVAVNGTGAALAGTGTVGGQTTVTSGVVRPGDNAGAGVGTLNITNSLIFNPVTSSTVAEFTILNHTAADRIHITGNLTLNSNSNLVVTFDPSYTATSGDSWTLLDWSGVLTLNGFSIGTNGRSGNNGALNEGNLDLPDLGSNLQWNISTLLDGSSGGALIVTIVPEPGRAVLLMWGLGSMALRRRRKLKPHPALAD